MEKLVTVITIREGKKYTYQVRTDDKVEFDPNGKVSHNFNKTMQIFMLELKKDPNNRGRVIFIDKTTPEEQAKIDADRKARAESMAAKEAVAPKKDK